MKDKTIPKEILLLIIRKYCHVIVSHASKILFIVVNVGIKGNVDQPLGEGKFDFRTGPR